MKNFAIVIVNSDEEPFAFEAAIRKLSCVCIVCIAHLITVVVWINCQDSVASVSA